ncbi:MAG: serine/threonine protein kinase [Rhodobacteraceae bacterium]|nr:serine/threonine protein kinase [Paracoccaceae bacterium]
MTAKGQMIPDDADYPDELRPGTVLLHGQYVIESYLVRGGFGITYLARDSLDRTVVIKECFPSAICCRADGRVLARSREQQNQYASVLRHFIREARRLSKLSHPDIVGVHQVFEERDTAYMALDFVDGSDLLTILEDDRARLSPRLIGSILKRTLEAVSYIHKKGILHRDISPDNILLDATDSPTLIDFGAARDHATKENRALSALLTVKDGYSPQEFYLSDEPQRPSSDLYSLGATFHHVITGQAPPHSQQRLAAVASRGDDPYVPLVKRVSGFDREFLAAIDRSLEIFADDRFQSADDWILAIERSLRRQVSTDRASQDANMLRAISELIENTAVTQFQPQQKRDAAPRPRMASRALTAIAPAPPAPAPEPADAPRQFVDIFGNPIDDVDAWLEAQERERAQAASGSRGNEAKKKDRAAPKTGFLRTFLSRKAAQPAGNFDT